MGERGCGATKKEGMDSKDVMEASRAGGLSSQFKRNYVVQFEKNENKELTSRDDLSFVRFFCFNLFSCSASRNSSF